MAKQATKKPSNVVKLPVNNPAIFPISGDVMPNGGNPKKDRVTFNGVLDFTGVDMQDLYRMAAQTIVIKLAGNCRQKFYNNKDKAGKHTEAFPVIVKDIMGGTIKVKDDIVSKLRSTTAGNRVEKIVSNIEKMSDEKKREMLDKLTNMLKAKK
jgi:hypothetical protein